MKKIFISVIFLFLFLNGFSQWFEHLPKPQKENQWEIKFFDKDYGLIIANSIITKTTNGGQSWDTITLAGPWYLTLLSDIFIYNKDTAYICGSGIWISTNGGNNWIKNNGGEVFSIYYSNPKNGVRIRCLTGDLYNTFEIGYTTNGGTNWHSTYSISEDVGRLYKLLFTDSLRGYAIGSGGIILKTNDGSKTWTQQITNTQHDLYSICFTDSLTGYVVGTSGIVLNTSDGGVHWNKQNLPSLLQLNSVHFPVKKTGYIVGNSGVILKTTDAGNTWSPQQSGTTLTLYSVFFTNENTGFAVGDSGLILKTTNGGNSFINLNDNVSSPIICYPNPFSKTTTIQYHHLEKGWVTIHIYDFSGKLVETMVNTILAPGDYNFYFDGAKHLTGIYYYCVKTETQVYSGKLVFCDY